MARERFWDKAFAFGATPASGGLSAPVLAPNSLAHIFPKPADIAKIWTGKQFSAENFCADRARDEGFALWRKELDAKSAAQLIPQSADLSAMVSVFMDFRRETNADPRWIELLRERALALGALAPPLSRALLEAPLKGIREKSKTRRSAAAETSLAAYSSLDEALREHGIDRTPPAPQNKPGL